MEPPKSRTSYHHQPRRPNASLTQTSKSNHYNSLPRQNHSYAYDPYRRNPYSPDHRQFNTMRPDHYERGFYQVSSDEDVRDNRLKNYNTGRRSLTRSTRNSMVTKSKISERRSISSTADNISNSPIHQSHSSHHHHRPSSPVSSLGPMPNYPPRTFKNIEKSRKSRPLQGNLNSSAGRSQTYDQITNSYERFSRQDRPSSVRSNTQARYSSPSNLKTPRMGVSRDPSPNPNQHKLSLTNSSNIIPNTNPSSRKQSPLVSNSTASTITASTPQFVEATSRKSPILHKSNELTSKLKKSTSGFLSKLNKSNSIKKMKNSIINKSNSALSQNVASHDANAENIDTSTPTIGTSISSSRNLETSPRVPILSLSSDLLTDNEIMPKAQSSEIKHKSSNKSSEFLETSEISLNSQAYVTHQNSRKSQSENKNQPTQQNFMMSNSSLISDCPSKTESRVSRFRQVSDEEVRQRKLKSASSQKIHHQV